MMRPATTLLSLVGVVALSGAGRYAAAAAESTTKVPLEIFASSEDVEAYPVEVGLPLPRGALKDASHLRLRDAGGQAVALQAEPLSRYPDGSLRAVLLVFLSPVSKAKSRTYTIEFGDGVSRRALPKTQVKVSGGGGAVTVDSGALRFQVRKGNRLLSEVSANGKKIVPEGLDLFIQEVGKKERVFSEQTDVVIEESGPVRSVILVKGRFGAAKDAYRYQVRIHSYAGTGLVRIQHTLLGLDAKKPFELAGWGLRVRTGAKEAACGVDGAPRKIALLKNQGFFQDTVFEYKEGTLSREEGVKRLKKKIPFKPGELSGWRYKMLHTLGKSEPSEGVIDGWLSADVADGNIGVCVRDFWQQCPKEFTGSGKDITVWLHSPRGAPFIAKAGTAKTHDILLDFSAGGQDAESVRALNAVFQDWPLARVSPEWVCATGVFGPLLPRSDPFSEHYNRMTDVILEFIRQTSGIMVNTACWYVYGNADFGDVAKVDAFTYNVSSEYSRAFTVEFLRGGDREWARLAARAARHYADIDVCHAKTDESDVGRPWNVNMAGALKRAPWPHQRFKKVSSMRALGTKGGKLDALKKNIADAAKTFSAVSVPRDVHQGRPGRGESLSFSCHMGGALPYYFLCGDRRALEVIREQGEWILKSRKTLRGRDLARVRSFHLSALLDAYEATGDVKFLEAAALIMKDLIAWWKIPLDKRKDFEKIKARMESNRIKQLVVRGAVLKGWKPPTHGFWEAQLGGGGRGIASWTRRDRSAFRFLELNVPEAKTGVDNAQVKRMLAECMETHMYSWAVQGCTPAYVNAWTMAANLELWPDKTRRAFEEKVVTFLALGRNKNYYIVYKNGLEPSPRFKYKLPFLHYKWHSRKKTGAFAPRDPKEMAKTNISNSTLYPYVCHLSELGVSQSMLDYPHFTAVWKKYHEKYLKPRMNAEGVLEFAIEPVKNSDKEIRNEGSE